MPSAIFNAPRLPMYACVADLVAADKKEILSNYPQLHQRCQELKQSAAEIAQRLKSAKFAARAARIAVFVIVHILAIATCIVLSVVPLMITASVALSPTTTLILISVGIAIAIAVQLLMHFFLLKKSNIDKLCTSLGIDKLDHKVEELAENYATTQEELSPAQGAVRLKKTIVKPQWTAKTPLWNSVSFLVAKGAENSPFGALPAEVTALIAQEAVAGTSVNPNKA